MWGSLAPYFDDMFVNLGITLLMVDSGVVFGNIVDAAFEQFQAEIDIDNPHWTETFRRNLVEHEMRAAIETLEAAEDSRLRASALLWLVHQGADASDTLIDPDPDVFSEVLSLVFVTSGPLAMLDLFEQVGPHDEQIATLNRLWRATSPTVAPVLAGLGRLHPTKAVAKAARKAAIQHASFVANRST